MVVDASAIVALLHAPEPGEDDPLPNFLALAELFELSAPALIGWELGNVVHRKHPDLLGEDVEARATILGRTLRDIVQDVPDDTALGRTGRLAESLRLTFYDAAYLELADRDGTAPLLTDDDRLHAAAVQVLGPDRVYRSTDP